MSKTTFTTDTLELAAIEKAAIEKALAEAGSINKAADLLGIDRNALRRRIAKHDITWTPAYTPSMPTGVVRA